MNDDGSWWDPDVRTDCLLSDNDKIQMKFSRKAGTVFGKGRTDFVQD
jgi:hypothetical protein